jgi:hypothetical protein
MTTLTKRTFQIGALGLLSYTASVTPVDAQYACADWCLMQAAQCTMGGDTWHGDCGSVGGGGQGEVCNLDSYCHGAAE